MGKISPREEHLPRMDTFLSVRRNHNAEFLNGKRHCGALYVSIKVVLGTLTLIPHTADDSQIAPNRGELKTFCSILWILEKAMSPSMGTFMMGHFPVSKQCNISPLKAVKFLTIKGCLVRVGFCGFQVLCFSLHLQKHDS